MLVRYKEGETNKHSKGKSKDKGKGKKSKKPESNLTNLKAANDTVRSRLEKKLFLVIKRVDIIFRIRNFI